MPLTDEEEVEELQGLIGGIPRGLFVKLEMAHQNRHLADDVRRDRREIDATRQRRREEQAVRTEALRVKAHKSSAEAAEGFRERVAAQGALVREETRLLTEARSRHKAMADAKAHTQVEASYARRQALRDNAVRACTPPPPPTFIPVTAPAAATCRCRRLAAAAAGP